MFWDVIQKPAYEVGQRIRIRGKSIGHPLELWGLVVGATAEIVKAMGPREAVLYLQKQGWNIETNEPIYLIRTIEGTVMFRESDLELPKLSWQIQEPRRITITYATVTPESAEQGDFAEIGWENEDGVEMEPDESDVHDGVTAVDKAVQYLQDEGARYEGGALWFTRVEERPGVRTVTYDYFLQGFTPEEVADVQGRMRR